MKALLAFITKHFHIDGWKLKCSVWSLCNSTTHVLNFGWTQSSSSSMQSLQSTGYNGNLVKEVRSKRLFQCIFDLFYSFSTWVLMVKWLFKCSMFKAYRPALPNILTTKCQIELIQHLILTIWKTLITSFVWEFDRIERKYQSIFGFVELVLMAYGSPAQHVILLLMLFFLFCFQILNVVQRSGWKFIFVLFSHFAFVFLLFLIKLPAKME